MLELGVKQGRQELAAEWQAVERGWYLADAALRERLLLASVNSNEPCYRLDRCMTPRLPYQRSSSRDMFCSFN